jgi:hypothetical protein
METRPGCRAVVALSLVSLLWLPACDSCPFALIKTLNFAKSVACCGGFERHDVSPGSAEASEFDVAMTSIPGQNAAVTAWLTRGDCDRLFAAAYDDPGASPLCEVLIGPVTPGQVSARRKLSSGPLRLFVQASAANPASAQYFVDVGVWGQSCRPGVSGP